MILVFSMVQLWTQDMDFDSIAYAIDLDEYVVTASYEPTNYKEAVHRISVIDKQEMRNRGAVNIEQALQTHSSIRFYNDPVLGTSVRMRGMGASNVAVLIDGVPVIGRLNGAIDLSQISLQNVERIEIVEGALSNIYGNNAAGGVINIITQRSVKSSLDLSLDSQFESVGIQNHDLGFGFRQSKLSGRVGLRYFNYDQFPVDSLRLVDRIDLPDGTRIDQSRYPFNPKEQMGLSSTFNYELNAHAFISLKYDRNTETVSDFGSVRRPQFQPYSNDNFFNTIRSDWTLVYKHEFSRYFIDITTALNSFGRTVDEKRYYLESGEFDDNLQFSDATHFQSIFNRSVISYNLAEDMKLVAGFMFSRESGSGDRIIDRMASDSTVASFYETAPFVDFKYEGIQNLSLSVSGRYTMHSQYANRFTPALHARYALNDKLIFRAGYSQGYRSPSLKELYLEFIDINHNIIGNLDLSPELSYDIQMSASYKLSKSTELSLNAYRTILNNRIGLVEYEALKFQYGNIDSYEVRGLQPALNYTIANVELSSGMTYGFWSTNINNGEAPQFGTVMDLNNLVSLHFKAQDIRFTLNHRHVGSQPIYRMRNDELEISRVQSYNLFDVSLAKSLLSEKLKLNIGIRNLMDIQAVDVLGGATGGVHSTQGRNAVNQGRSLFFSLAYRY